MRGSRLTLLAIALLVATSFIVMAANATDNETEPVLNGTDTTENETITQIATNETEESPGLIATVLRYLLDEFTFIKGEPVTLTARLEANGTPLPEETIAFDGLGEQATNEAGEASVLWNTSNLTAGVYLIGVDYAGTQRYESASDSVTITLEEPEAEELVAEESEEVDEEPVEEEEEAETVDEEEQLAELDEEEEPLAEIAIVEQPSTTKLDLPIEEHTLLKTNRKSGDAQIAYEQTCSQTVREEEIPEYGSCSEIVTKKICSDYPVNETCTEEKVEEHFTCVTKIKHVVTTDERCKTRKIAVNKGIVLSVEGYECSAEKSEGSIVVTCDSLTDGNGDGVCRSGESCQQFVIKGKEVTRYEKNSDLDYKVISENYYLPSIDVEVKA